MKSRLLTRCPKKGEVVATHAVMQPRAFSKLRSELIFYCSSCHTHHVVARDAVWMEGEAPVPTDGVLTESVLTESVPTEAGLVQTRK